jgi:hypothetical protein
LAKLGQGDVMDYYWYAYPEFAALLTLILDTNFTGGFPGIRDKNPSSRGRDLVEVAPHLPHKKFHALCTFIPIIHAGFVGWVVGCTKECING